MLTADDGPDFSGNMDQTIDLATGAAMTAAYRAANPGQQLGEYFSKKTLLQILNQPGCTGIRRYNGISADTPSSVYVGVNSTGDDMVDGVLGDRSVKSPPYGGSANVLNS